MSDPTRGSSNGRLFWTTGVLVIVLDVMTKLLAERYLTPHVPKRVFGDFARLTLAYNPGAAFSMHLGPYSRYIFGAFAVVALVILWRLYRHSPPRDVLRVLALGLAWGGAAGNLIDRLRSGYVVDFVDLYWRDWHFWAFNVADAAITVGVSLMILDLLQIGRHRVSRAV